MNTLVAADYIASHAVAALLAVTLVMTLLTALLWSVVKRAGPRLLTYLVSRLTAWSQHSLVVRLQTAPMFGGALRTTVRRTISVARYLGVHALISFLVAIVAVIGFVELADEIGVGESLAVFDSQLSAALSRHLSDTVLQFSAVITHLGDMAVLTGLVIIVAIGLLVRREFVLAWAWLATTTLGGLVTRLLKAWFERTRPIHEHGFAAAGGWSFPSGHASGSMLVYGLLGYLLVRHTRDAWHIPIVVATLIVVVFVGGSRVLLQVHFLSDVLAGWTTAIVWLSLCITGLEAVRRQTRSK